MSMSPDPSKPPVDLARDPHPDSRESIPTDAGETGGNDRDLAHGEGGALGLGEDEDLNHDD